MACANRLMMYLAKRISLPYRCEINMNEDKRQPFTFIQPVNFRKSLIPRG